MNKPNTSFPTGTLIILAFAAIYLVWGSTYLAIRVVIETLPPFLSAGVRFVVAGGVLFALLRARGVAKPSHQEWRNATITGGLLLVGGNGLVVWAEKSISSGLAALIVALAPVWFALIDWLRPQGVRPRGKTIVGIVIGFVGVLMLVNGRSGAPGTGYWGGAFAVMVAGVCWAAGSLYSKHHSQKSSPWMTAATQMVCGGTGLLLVGGALGEPFTTQWQEVSARSLWALAYLIVFGSWIGFSAYIWLLNNTTPTRVSTYAYVNPVIAVFLGWALLGETVTTHMFWGALVVLLGVIIITLPGALMVNGWARLRPPVVR